MAWPPPTLPTNRIDTTVMAGTHPADHNAANLAINDIVARMGRGSFRVIGGGVGQAMSSGVPTVATWATEVSDTLNAINAGVFVCPATHAGRWLFEWSVRWPGPSTGVRQVFLATTPAARLGQATVGQPAAGDMNLTGAVSVALTAGQNAQVTMFHNHSAGLTCNLAADEYFQGWYLGPAT